jgi:hypothetical protein
MMMVSLLLGKSISAASAVVVFWNGKVNLPSIKISSENALGPENALGMINKDAITVIRIIRSFKIIFSQPSVYESLVTVSTVHS